MPEDLKDYPQVLKDYGGEILLVGINGASNLQRSNLRGI